MRLDVSVFKFLRNEHFRVLIGIELGMRNHSIVPTNLIQKLSKLKHGGIYSLINSLHKFKLVHHESKPYDGYKLTYLGYDYLALRTFVKRGTITSVGRKIGTGKESDVYEVMGKNENEVLCLKLHRLGRTSFRDVKRKRGYLKNRNASSWLYLSRLSALKEFAYMRALYIRKFPVPRPVDSSRHAVLMSYVEGAPLCQITYLEKPNLVIHQMFDMMERLARHGLVHCDFNEFNVIIDDNHKVTLFDFPQMIPIDHPQAEEFFFRDVNFVKKFFARKFNLKFTRKVVFPKEVVQNTLLEKKDIKNKKDQEEQEVQQQEEENNKNEDKKEEKEKITTLIPKFQADLDLELMEEIRKNKSTRIAKRKDKWEKELEDGVESYSSSSGSEEPNQLENENKSDEEGENESTSENENESSDENESSYESENGNEENSNTKEMEKEKEKEKEKENEKHEDQEQEHRIHRKVKRALDKKHNNYKFRNKRKIKGSRKKNRRETSNNGLF
ncbi:serine/threonine-protein kinase rio2 [Anaeramoeba flamelloides]|uniref:Serine/threonine-protein kinase RIO2 n=1 Tax=Anaeramoeba flamelloides TaxID=1746091 RepID=A0AAV8A6C6_9EUKA|nr:serine/threonine-protein kinase rio2 [Anaeramoeba flamelloides]